MWKCEELADNVVLLPGEAKWLKQESFPCIIKEIEKIDCLTGECEACSDTWFRTIRPIDCKTFPYAIFYIEDGFYLMVCTICPVSDNLPKSFIEEVEDTWNFLLDYEEVRDHIKSVCRIRSLNISLEWKVVKLLRKDGNKRI